MLLPSDVARLVLGYLQEEGLSVTSQAFIQESPNLKEYADHTTGDGTIPACVFSVFGKGLTTILNEYVATKTKESRHEVPAVMTSLWKKLDFTLNQIKSLQNSPVISACQRTRSRIGVANMTRQRVLTVSSPTAVNCSSVSETSSIISPAHTSQSILNHSTPLSFTTLHSLPASFPEAQQQIHDVRLNAPRDSPAQIVSENRLSAGPMSPGRRKWDTPRKRAGVVGGCSGPSRYSANGTFAEPQLEEAVDENFPQLVIQNARDKMLGDRSLQEKLAENINKILASDPVPQVSKTSSSTLEADQSIDEILGLQGEIHMSDDAIHDILAQTESDPAFQALYDLFDCNKARFTDPGDEVNNCCLEGSDTAGPASLVKPLQSDDPGNTNKDVHASDAVPVTVKTKTGQERKTRKSVAPTLLKKTVLAPSGRSSRIENSSARLLVSHGELTGPKAAGDSHKKAKSSVLNNSNFVVTPMNIDEPLVTLPPPSVNMATLEPTSKNDDSSSTARIESAAPSIADQKQLNKQAQVSEDQHDDASLAKSNQSIVSLHLPVEPNSTPSATADLPQMAISSNEGDTRPVLNHSASPESASSASVSSAAPCTTTSDSESVSTSTVLMTAANPTLRNSSTPFAGSASVGEEPGPVSSHSGTSKPAGDSNVVSLKIIISDDQDEDSFSDPALRQAVSSISADKIPTIYLTSPAKSPGVSGTPKITSDEVAQAVSGLQNSETHGSPVCTRAGTLDGSQLTGTSQVQQNYIIQLPLDSTTRAIQGAPASYFLVTEPPATDAQTRPMLLSAGVPKGQPLPFHQYGATTQTNSQSYSTGSTLILPSPANPMMLPVSVTGQNAMGRVQMVPNQLVTIQNALPIQQPETVSSSSPAVAVNRSTSADTEQVAKLVQTQSSDNKTQQDAAKSNAHRRILCFDSSSEVQMQPMTTTLLPVTNATTRQSAQQMQKDNRSATRTRPNILGGNKLKRRVQPVTLAVPQIEGSFAKADKSKNLVKKNVQKQDLSTCSTETRCAGTSRTDASQPNTEKKVDSKILDGKYSHNKDGDGVKAKDVDNSRVVSSDSAMKSKKEKEESSKKELGLKSSAKPRDGRTEKSAPSEEVPNITANKENEIKGTTQEQQAAPSSSASRDFSPQDAAQPTTNPHPKGSKTPSKTSSLAKQAAEMLHNIQGLNSPSTPVMKATTGSSELPCRNQEETADSTWTPSRQKKGKDVEGTPKHLMHPSTPDVPTCSPASETGSENSINMAAHTLMILSRATIARTGTPLKDSLRQDGAGEKLPTSSKNSKKRKLSSPTATAPAKKDKERKKLIDCFPLDLDVDKFLSSLHYDE